MEDDELHLALHREADGLGKFATQMRIESKKKMSKNEAAHFLDELLAQVTQTCFDHGADLVGHVKAFMKSPTGAMSASLIDLKKRANITNEFGMDDGFNEAEVTLHVIVHGIWDPEVRELSLQAIDRVCEQYGLEHTILKDYYETEKGIAHHLQK
jgi:predicted glycosyl hydrolase (DUF1957 family)